MIELAVEQKKKRTREFYVLRAIRSFLILTSASVALAFIADIVATIYHPSWYGVTHAIFTFTIRVGWFVGGGVLLYFFLTKSSKSKFGLGQYVYKKIAFKARACRLIITTDKTLTFYNLGKGGECYVGDYDVDGIVNAMMGLVACYKNAHEYENLHTRFDDSAQFANALAKSFNRSRWINEMTELLKRHGDRSVTVKPFIPHEDADDKDGEGTGRSYAK